MTPEERASRLIRELETCLINPTDNLWFKGTPDNVIMEALKEAEARGYRRGVADASRIAEGDCLSDPSYEKCRHRKGGMR